MYSALLQSVRADSYGVQNIKHVVTIDATLYRPKNPDLDKFIFAMSLSINFQQPTSNAHVNKT